MGKRQGEGLNFRVQTSRSLNRRKLLTIPPLAYPVSRFSLYLCSAEGTVAVPPGRKRAALSRASLGGGLNKIIARISAESLAAREIAALGLPPRVSECPFARNVRERFACNVCAHAVTRGSATAPKLRVGRAREASSRTISRLSHSLSVFRFLFLSLLLSLFLVRWD